MSPRLIDLCLLAYPAAVRERDRAHLHDLATDLARDHGTLREAFGLLRGGLAERRRRSRARSTVIAAGAAAFLVLTALTWTATAQSGTVEEDVFACEGRCSQAEAEATSKIREGWTCAETAESAGMRWRCVLD